MKKYLTCINNIRQNYKKNHSPLGRWAFTKLQFSERETTHKRSKFCKKIENKAIERSHFKATGPETANLARTSQFLLVSMVSEESSGTSFRVLALLDYQICSNLVKFTIETCTGRQKRQNLPNMEGFSNWDFRQSPTLFNNESPSGNFLQLTQVFFLDMVVAFLKQIVKTTFTHYITLITFQSSSQFHFKTNWQSHSFSNFIYNPIN